MSTQRKLILANSLKSAVTKSLRSDDVTQYLLTCLQALKTDFYQYALSNKTREKNHLPQGS